MEIRLEQLVLCICIGLFCSSYALAEAEVSAPSLCKTNDIVLFSCKTTNDKIISLCGKGTEENLTSVYYRFERQNKIEMDFPKEKDENSFSKFTYDQYSRGIEIYFDNNSYSYVLYEPYSNSRDEDRSGISVRELTTNKRIANINCKLNPGSDLYILTDKIGKPGTRN